MKNSNNEEFSIVALDKFILATRDSGYKGTSSAVAELVDNSLQAGAIEVCVTITVDEDEENDPIVLTVLDNGCGMNTRTLRTALRFGGSSRFNDRSGLGRYGMGLPNSSLSQAKRVTVHTWRTSGWILQSFLDIDEISAGNLTEVPAPKRVAKPSFINGSDSGTAVTWSRCDRLDNRRISTISRKLLVSLGRQFRHYLWDGVAITVNGDDVEPIDPLFLHPSTRFSGGAQFGEDLVYEVSASPEDPTTTGVVRVRFSELPVTVWSKLSNKEKRERGIAKGAGVSIVRAGREVDYGWFFLRGKRRENYDDWWRCEIQFDPVLDEAFGITHTKQQVHPQPHLVEALSADMESIARALNSRTRKAHLDAKVAERFNASEQLAEERDKLLAPLPPASRPRDERVLGALEKHASPPTWSKKQEVATAGSRTQYRIVSAPLSETVFFNYARDKDGLVLILNPEHPFYKIVYKPLLDSDTPRDGALRTQLDLLLLAAARNEAILEEDDAERLSELFRKGGSDTLATFLNG